ncbi:uncharacterized protein LOC131208015 [Anopheles bellator]|uniref:uncharacterized protein LOC131208015 n=1 Tax=Anopheles bellator TaxID=139047 RepID=UPI002648C5BD|nr:uncharacterized protein LOC131208015 [Anopheles bellator]
MFFRRVFSKNGSSSSSSAGEGVGGGAGHGMSVSVPTESPARYRRALNVENNHRVLSVLQLTPLWEYIIRNNELPVGLNMNELFREFLERLHDPEFQVRQHALRVLIDVIIVLRDETDVYFAPLLPPIIDNLGHPSPAVRKGALDVLKVYIAQTKLPETVMLEIMNYGMDRNPKDPLASRYIVGVMLALPSLIQPAILTAKRTFILRAVINALGGKMVQITYQEIALKILLKIKNAIGSREFYECISVAYRRDFDLLCNVYGLPNPPKSPRRDVTAGVPDGGGRELLAAGGKSWKPHPVPLSPKAQRWKSGSQGDLPRATAYDPPVGGGSRMHADYALTKSPSGQALLRRVSLDKLDDSSKVILETEIKINKESVTMRILEAGRDESGTGGHGISNSSEESDEDNVGSKRFGVVRVLTDSELEDSVTVKSIAAAGTPSSSSYYQPTDPLLQSASTDTDYVRRTPRRVRFGGEIVKMRTPDSDTFDQSDQDPSSMGGSQSSTNSSSFLTANLPSETISSPARSTSSMPSRSSLKSASSVSDRSAAALMRRQFSQSADTERSTTASMGAMTFENDTSYVSSILADGGTSTTEPPDTRPEPETGNEHSAPATRPKSSLARPKSSRTPPPHPDPVPAPETPDNQSHQVSEPPEPPSTAPPPASDASSVLADKIEEVKQAIQGIEDKINNVVCLKKADSADAAQQAAARPRTPKLEPTLSLEVLLKTADPPTDNADNFELSPSQTDPDRKDYTKELNIDIPSEEKLQNTPPPKTDPPAPRLAVRSGIPRLHTMPSPKTMRKAQEATATTPKLLTPDEPRGRSRLRSRSATSTALKPPRSVYISPSSLSPAPHSGIEIMHNLLRSPSTSPHRTRRKSSGGKPIDALTLSDNNNNQLALELGPEGQNDKCISVNEDDIFDVFGKTIATQTSGDELPAVPTFVPFSRAPSWVTLKADGGAAEPQDTLDARNGNRGSPARDGPQDGDRLAVASPKGSAGKQRIVSSWEDLEIVDRLSLIQLKSTDWRLRSQGFCRLEEALKSSDNLAKVQPYLESLLRTLLSSERNHDVIDDRVRMLVNLVSRLPLENLEDRVGQIMTGLCRQGGAGSNTVAKALMQRLPTAAIVQRLLSDDFLHAKNSKFRENALQMVLFALMTFPSTYFDIKSLIGRATEAALDSKKRVRHAALDVLAVLGQISSPKLVLDVVCTSVGIRPEGNHLITAVKARLARKQLPFIGPDGSVEYALKVPSNRTNAVIMFGADVDWIEAGSGSASPTFDHRALTSGSRSKYPSFQIENSSSEETRPKPSFQVFDEIKQPIASSKVISSGWTSKIPVSYSDNLAQPPPSNAPRAMMYGNGKSSRSYPELLEAANDRKYGAGGGLRKPDFNQSAIPQFPQCQGKLVRHSTIAPSKLPEMDHQRMGVKIGKPSNPYEVRTPRMRAKLYSRNSDGFMSDTIASVNKQVHTDIRPSTDPVVEHEGLRQLKCGMRFYNPNLVGSGTNRQQITAHEQDTVEQRSNCRSYVHGGGRHSRGNSANDGRATPHRTRFLEEDPHQPTVAAGGGAGINQESYTIRRDEEYDSEQDEKSSNDSTSTRIISNSVFNFGSGHDRSRPPSSTRPPSGAGSLKSLSSGNLRGQQYAPEGRGSRASNLSYGTGGATIIKHHSTDNVSLRSGRCELDGISSNQVQYESDYDDDEDYDHDDQERRKAGIGGTPKRYPTPSPLPLRASCSTDNLPGDRDADKSADEDYEEEAFEEMTVAAPKSRAQSASMGNLAPHMAVRDLGDADGGEMLAEPQPSRPAPVVSVVPRKILKKPFLERRSSKVAPVVKDVVSSVKAKNKLNEVLFEKTLRRFDKPRDALANCLTHLESPNWEQNISGLQFFVRLIRHHPEVIDTQIHLLSVALSKQVRNLRSQVARTACKASSEFFTTHRRCIEGEAEDIATHLLHRTADTNKFLRADATQALESMCENLSVARVVHIVAFKGATHQNAVVRTTAAKLLDKIVTQIGGEKVFGLPKETRDKLILTGAHLLLEGSLETRNYTKSMFKKLADHPHYSKVLLEVIPSRTYRNIEKALNSIRQMA